MATSDYRKDWNERASKNARGYTASDDHETEELFEASGRRDTDLILRVSGLEPEKRYIRSLEIGCGIGRLMMPLLNRFETVQGADVSDEMLRQARERFNNRNLGDRTKFLLVDGNGRIPTEESFDFIYSYTVFQHIRRQDTAKYIDEVARLLDPKGVGVLHFVEPFGVRRTIQALLHIDPPSSDTLRFRYFRPSEVSRMCRKSGLILERREKSGIYGLYRVRRSS